MKTLILQPTEENIKIAGKALQNGELVAIPTETVYGLAANALKPESVTEIFSAKGRPQDNPLIIHISKKEDCEKYAKNISDKAKKLMDKFWPGPLTIVLEAKDIIPSVVTAGLNTVAIRCPENEIARKLIEASGVPLAAPSANISGKPSPTSAKHVFHDLNGKIPYIIDGGMCNIGVESTVVTLATNKPILLRPGKISREEIEKVIGDIDISEAVFHKMSDDFKAQSPGMKYRHYAPNAKIIVVDGEDEDVIRYISHNVADVDGILCFDGDENKFEKGLIISIGDKNDPMSLSHNLFDALRKFDAANVSKIYARCCLSSGEYLGVYNRLMKAAGYNIIKIGE